MSKLTNDGLTVQQIVEHAHRDRTSGKWRPWRWHKLPDGVPGSSGWAKEFRRVAENGVFTVLVRELDTAWGKVTHAMISDVLKWEPTWAEKQRIKDEVFGRLRVAVEVMPPHNEVVDQASAYHMWVMPAGFRLPFSIFTESELQAPETEESRLRGLLADLVQRVETWPNPDDSEAYLRAKEEVERWA